MNTQQEDDGLVMSMAGASRGVENRNFRRLCLYTSCDQVTALVDRAATRCRG